MQCGHTFCRDCIEGELKIRNCCPTCNAHVLQTEDFLEPEGLPDEEDEEDNEGGHQKPRRSRKKKEKAVGDDANWVQPKMKDSSKWMERYDENYPDKILGASAKTIAVKNQILLWQKEAPDDKIIGTYQPEHSRLSRPQLNQPSTKTVFVNWAKLACIIGRMLNEEQIPFLYYFGDLKLDQKDAAITTFQTNPEIKILVRPLPSHHPFPTNTP